MERTKITPENVWDVIRASERRTFNAFPLYLIQNCTYEKVGDTVRVFYKPYPEYREDELLFPAPIPELNQNISFWGWEDDFTWLAQAGIPVIAKEEYALDFFYTTSDFITLAGPKFKKIRNEINSFQREYPQAKFLHEYPREKLIAFIEAWSAETRSRQTDADALAKFESEYEDAIAAVDLAQQVAGVQSLYLEVDGKLIGYAVFGALYDDFWVAYIQKTLREYRGAGKMLYNEKAKIMEKYPTFANGCSAQVASLNEYKLSLNPSRTVMQYHITTGTKI